MLVRFKDKPGRLFRQEVECMGKSPDGFGCGRDCDGGGFSAKVAGQGLLLEQDPAMQGLRLQSSCDPDEEGSDIRLDPKDDATAFQLNRQPANVCLAQRDAARPSWATATPLRVRFAKRESVCHVRRYDAAHLARHPEQKVAAIAVKTDGPIAIDQQDGFRSTTLDIKISLRLRDGSTATRNALCAADGYLFGCSAGGNTMFNLMRAGERGVTVREINFRKVFDEKENYLAALMGRPAGRRRSRVPPRRGRRSAVRRRVILPPMFSHAINDLAAHARAAAATPKNFPTIRQGSALPARLMVWTPPDHGRRLQRGLLGVVECQPGMRI